MAFKQCYWLYFSNELAAIPEGATPLTTEDVGAQSMGSLYEGIGYDDVAAVDLYQDNYGDVYAAVGFMDASMMILKRKCDGTLVSPYLIGLAAGAAIGGIAGSRIKRLQRFRPASTLMGVALGMIAGGVTSHLLVKRGTGKVAGRMGLIEAQKLPSRSIGSLYLPRGGGLPKEMHVGLVEATKRYAPKGKNW